jgi:alkylhydroperoxidase/carboxymuconolactone decarboxylase family protein YurZ
VSKQGRRFFRTIVIGTFALAALVWMAMDQFGVERDEMLELLLVTAVVVGLVILVAACVAGLWIALRKVLRRP